MPITAQTYERVALEDPDGKWELVCGRLRNKPAMTLEHNGTARRLAMHLTRQIDFASYLVDQDMARLRAPSGEFYIPDVCVIPLALERQLRRERPWTLELIDEPLPLVVEVWSPSTGSYDLGQKLHAYQARGDREIWFLHPYEHWLRAWRRQADGSYAVTRFTGDAVVAPVALPGVQIALAALFE
ncbi:MAG TPA: Uma2 family endonuclease [Dehalococcoidia bacterium]|nr:Uma2 family endonuclease [Dehalococcoidia bacterium]